MTSEIPQIEPGLGYSVVANWGSRSEQPEFLAAYWIKAIARFRSIDPLFLKWYDGYDVAASAPMDLHQTRLAQRIALNVGTNDDGTPQPVYGYRLSTRNLPYRSSSRFTVNMSAGASGLVGTNNVNGSTEYGLLPNPNLITYEVFKGVLVALAETFRATRAYAYPDSLSDFWPKSDSWQPKLELAWISYIAPQFANLITPPSTAIVERRPDGGLLMSATDETFVTTNPAHMAVARDIEAAVAPFNALPWPPETARA